MGRIMQVIDKRSNFMSGTVDLKLYQTNFIGLTKVITDVPGQTVLNATEGQNVGYQFFHDLCLKQLETRNYVDRFKPVYNVEIDRKKPTVNGLLPFSYNWKSCVDYRNQIVSGDKADYRLFQKVVNAEKELYDYRLYVSDHVKRNCDIMAVWSADRMYGSNVNTIRTKEIETHGSGDHGWELISNGIYIQGEIIYGARDKRYVDLKNLQNIPVGQSDFLTVRTGGTTFKLIATRNILGTTEDDGYFNLEIGFEYINNAGDIHRFNGVERWIKSNKVKSPHFRKTGIYDLEFFKTRRLI